MGIRNPIDARFPGLSDLGMGGQSSMSNSVGDQQGPLVLDELLQNSRGLKSPQAQALAIQRAQDDLAAQETPGFLDNLLSMKNLPAIGGMLAALIAKEPALAAGMGIGSINNAQIMGAEAKHAKSAAQADLQERHDKQLDMIDKQQARVADLLTRNPDLFINSATGRQAIDPVSLGVLTTGREIPLDVVSQHNMQLWQGSKKRMFEDYADNMATATQPQERNRIVQGMESLLGYQFPPEVKAALARNPVADSDYMDDVNKAVIKDMFMNPKTGATGLAAMRAMEAENAWDRPTDFVHMLSWTEDPDASASGIAQRAWDLTARIDAWWNDPNVPMEDKLATGGDIPTIAAKVFENEPGTLAQLQDKVDPTRPWLTQEDVARTYFQINGQLNQFDQTMAIRDLARDRDDPAARRRALEQRTSAALDGVDRMRRSAAVTGARDVVSSGAMTLAQQLGNRHPAGTYINWSNAAIDQAEQILKREGREATPENFNAAFQRAISAKVIVEQQRMNPNGAGQ